MKSFRPVIMIILQQIRNVSHILMHLYLLTVFILFVRKASL